MPTSPTPIILLLAALLLAAGVPATGALPLPEAAAEETPPPVPLTLWTARDVPTTRALHDVAFHNDTLGWAAAEDGVVYRTEDGGRSWELRHTGLFQAILRLSFVDANVGIAMSEDLAVARTTDGGLTWTVLSRGGFLSRGTDTHFLDASRGYAVGQTPIFQGYLLATTDGGATWEPTSLTTPDTESSFLRVTLTPDGTRAWVLATLFPDGSGVFLSRDSGATWTFVPVSPTSTLTDLAMATPEVGIAVGAAGEAYRTTDGGLTWSRLLVPSALNLLDADFADANRGWIMGERGTVLVTLDGGLTWTVELSGTADDLHRADFTPTGNGWAVGAAGVVRHRDAAATFEDQLAPLLPALPQGLPSPPLLVTGDEGFADPRSGVKTGSGTPEDPYVIEGYDIVPTATDGITLVGTTAHVVIRGNRIHDAVGDYSAIRLVDARNVTIHGNQIENTYNGVTASGGADLTVAENLVSGVRRTGVDASRTARVAVLDNVVRESAANGVDLVAVAGADVARNVFTFNRLSGLRLSALATLGTTDAWVHGNHFTDNRDGIRAVRATRLLAEGNAFMLSDATGLNLELATASTVRGNVLYGNADADIRIGTGSTGTLVEGNGVHARTTGILLQGDTGTLARANHVRGGDSEGIRLSASRDATVEENIVTDAGLGLRVTDASANNLLRANHVTPFYWGFQVEGGSSGNVLEGNEVTSLPGSTPESGAHDGITVTAESHDNVVRGNRLHDLWSGVSVIGRSQRTLVEGNEVARVLYNGITVTFYSTGTIVRNNTVEDVGRYALWVNGLADNALVEHNLIRNVMGRALSVGSVSHSTVRGNTIENATIGLVASDECPLFADACDSISNRVEGNTFRGIGETGLLAFRYWMGTVSDLRVTDNTFEGAGTAMSVTDAVGFIATGNAFDGFTVGLTAAAAGTVDARSNWWGDASGPSGIGPGTGAAISAAADTNVLYAPWLTAR